MATNDLKIWIVLDSFTKIQSQPLSDEQLQMSILRMHEKDWDRFYIWTQSWENWQPLRLFLQSNEKNFLNVLNITKIDQNLENTITKSVTYVRTDNELTSASYKNKEVVADMDSLDPDKIKSPQNINFKNLNLELKLNQNEIYKNRSIRHELKIELLLISKIGKTFRSYSRNISLTGSLLEDNIPFDYYDETFDVIVVNRYAKDASKSRVQLKGVSVGDGVSRRIQFESLSEHTKDKLIFLLKEYLEHQKNVSKKSA